MQNTEGWGSEGMCNRAHPSPCAHIETKQHVDFISIFARASIKLSQHSQLFQARPAISLGATRNFLCPPEQMIRGCGRGERSPKVRYARDWTRPISEAEEACGIGEYAPSAASAARGPVNSRGDAASAARAASPAIQNHYSKETTLPSHHLDPATA